jgi:ribonuclease Y
MSFLHSLTKIFKPKAIGRPQPSAEAQVKPIVKPEREKQHPPKRLAMDNQQLMQAQTQAKELILSAKEEAFRIKQQALERVNQLRTEYEDLQQKALTKRTELERKEAVLDEKQNLVQTHLREVEERLAKVDRQKKELIDKLEKVAQFTREEARVKLLEATEKKLTEEIATRIQQAEDEIKESAEGKAREILIDAMRFGATDYVAEYTVSTVKIEDEEMKGRVIGKEGRNIRAFEKATGVDVDLDEEGVIRLSSYDSVRREIARVSLEKLLRDGRIQPSRIEEVIDKTRVQTESLMLQAGEMLAHKVQVYNLPREIIQVLGRFKYRFSYGQSMITHTMEETKIGVALAHELGANVNVVRLGCLLHDIGKVITEEEGSHVQLGVDFLKKFNIPKSVIDCIAQHHEDEPFSSPESVIVYIADAVSGARPGARYEDYEEYVKRMKAIEDLTKGFEGVQEAYAVQAGREVRVIVAPEKLTDAQSIKLAHDLKNKIQEKLTFPGTIKITVIREFRQVEVAK